jgi:hypothetical protein
MVAGVSRVVYVDGVGAADERIDDAVDAAGGADQDACELHEINLGDGKRGPSLFEKCVGLEVLAGVPEVEAHELGFTGDLTIIINPTLLERLKLPAVQSRLEDGTWVLVVLVNRKERYSDGRPSRENDLTLAQVIFGRGDHYSAPSMILSGDGRKHMGCFIKEELGMDEAGILKRLLLGKVVERGDHARILSFQRVKQDPHHCRCDLL